MIYHVSTTTPGSRVEVITAPSREDAMVQAARIFGNAPLVVTETHRCSECGLNFVDAKSALLCCMGVPSGPDASDLE